MTDWNFKVEAKGSDTVKLYVYDQIGSDFFGDGVTAKDVAKKLDENAKAKTIELRINSTGGLVDEARAMVSLLEERKEAGAQVIAYVDGLAASSAAYLTTAADTVVMPDNAFFMIHEVKAGARGTSKELRSKADVMDRYNQQVAEAFAKCSKRRGVDKSMQDYLDTFKNGDTYLDAAEAIEWGLVDEIGESLDVAASLVDLSQFDGLPEALESAPYAATSRMIGADGKVKALGRRPIGKKISKAPVAPKMETEPPVAEPQQQAAPMAPTEGQAMSKTDLDIMAIARDLGLPVGSTERDVAVRTSQLHELDKAVANATGAKNTVEGIGAVRALAEAAGRLAETEKKLAEVEATRNRQEFDSLVNQALAERKMTPAECDFKRKGFEDAEAAGTSASTAFVGELRGWIAVAAPRIPQAVKPRAQQAHTSEPLTLNGKRFVDLAPMERARLSQSDPDMYEQMRAQAVEAGEL